MSLWKSKLKAFSIHLALSIVVILLFLLIVTQFIFSQTNFAKIGERHYPLVEHLNKVAEKTLGIKGVKNIDGKVKKQVMGLSEKQDNLLLPLQASNK